MKSFFTKLMLLAFAGAIAFSATGCKGDDNTGDDMATVNHDGSANPDLHKND